MSSVRSMRLAPASSASCFISTYTRDLNDDSLVGLNETTLPIFKQTRKLRTEWACVFKYLEGQLDQCLPAWRAVGPMARTTLAKVRSLLTFQEAKAGVEPKNMKITYAAKMLRKRLKKAAAAAAEAAGAAQTPV